MEFILFCGAIATLVVLYKIFKRLAQRKAFKVFQKKHPTLLSDVEQKLQSFEADEQSSDFAHSVKYKDYGQCECCQRGRLVLRRNGDSFFIGCTSYHSYRYTNRRYNILKSCNFTFPVT